MTIQTLYTAATGMEAMESKLDVIANNMANINTTAFKKDRANFEDVFYRNTDCPVPWTRTAVVPRPASKSVSVRGFPARNRTSSRVRFKRLIIHSILRSKATGFSRYKIRTATAFITHARATSI